MAKILVIDDEADFREVVRVILENCGHEVLEAENGEVGIAMCRETIPDLIITDIFMPGKDGIEIIREFHASNPNIGIIAMSGGGDAHEMMFLGVAKTFGAAAIIEKPFKASELMALVEEQLEKYGVDGNCENNVKNDPLHIVFD